MRKQILLLIVAAVSGVALNAQSLPEGTTALLPDGVTANIGQEKQFFKQKKPLHRRFSRKGLPCLLLGKRC